MIVFERITSKEFWFSSEELLKSSFNGNHCYFSAEQRALVLEALVENLDKNCTRYKMKMSAEKTKLVASKWISL